MNVLNCTYLYSEGSGVSILADGTARHMYLVLLLLGCSVLKTELSKAAL